MSSGISLQDWIGRRREVSLGKALSVRQKGLSVIRRARVVVDTLLHADVLIDGDS